MGVLRLLDADETMVLFDFHDPTGAANPGIVLDEARRRAGPRIDRARRHRDPHGLWQHVRRDARAVVAPGTTIGRTLVTSASIPASNASLEAEAVSELQGIARFNFHEGKVEEFKRLSAQAMEIVRTKDTGTLQYDIYFNDDQAECIVLERFRDSEALIEHFAHLGDQTEAFLATVSVVRGELLGEPGAELRAKLAGSEVPVLFTPVQSM